MLAHPEYFVRLGRFIRGQSEPSNRIRDMLFFGSMLLIPETNPQLLEVEMALLYPRGSGHVRVQTNI